MPEDSKARAESGCPEFASVLERAGHALDKWRCLDANSGSRGMNAMIDTDRPHALAKAARVPLDEAETIRHGFSLRLDANQTVSRVGDPQSAIVRHGLRAKSARNPPRQRFAEADLRRSVSIEPTAMALVGPAAPRRRQINSDRGSLLRPALSIRMLHDLWLDAVRLEIMLQGPLRPGSVSVRSRGREISAKAKPCAASRRLVSQAPRPRMFRKRPMITPHASAGTESRLCALAGCMLPEISQETRPSIDVENCGKIPGAMASGRMKETWT